MSDDLERRKVEVAGESPAFPQTLTSTQSGLTLRDWLIGQVLAGPLPAELARDQGYYQEISDGETFHDRINDYAYSAVRIADATIEMLVKMHDSKP